MGDFNHSFYADKLWYTEVVVSLPRFRVESKLPLNDALKNLGIKDMFTDNADLGGISKESLYVSDVVQKAVIEVEESGTTAAAATAVVVQVVVSLSQGQPRTFTADHPFLFQLRDLQTRMLLFQGRVTDPTHPTSPGREGQPEDSLVHSIRPTQAALWPCKYSGVVAGNEQFSKRLYSKVMGEPEVEPRPGNLVVSPSSLSTVLAMLAVGATGHTLTQLQAELDLPREANAQYKCLLSHLKSDGRFTLEVANGIFARNTFRIKRQFKRDLATYFFSVLDKQDFSEKHINNWVEQNTRNEIKDLLSPGSITPLTQMVLVNAIYFKAAWMTKFEPKLTYNGEFTNENGQMLGASMMTQSSTFEVAHMDMGRMIRLPYAGGRIVMDIFLPHKQKVAGTSKNGILKDVENMFERTNMHDLFTQKKRSVEIELHLPKFKVETSIPLNGILAKLGMGAMFDGGLGGISNSPDLHVSDVIQKAMIEVDEEGATALWFNRGMGPKLKSFILAIFSPVCNGGFGHRIM